MCVLPTDYPCSQTPSQPDAHDERRVLDFDLKSIPWRVVQRDVHPWCLTTPWCKDVLALPRICIFLLEIQNWLFFTNPSHRWDTLWALWIPVKCQGHPSGSYWNMSVWLTIIAITRATARVWLKLYRIRNKSKKAAYNMSPLNTGQKCQSRYSHLQISHFCTVATTFLSVSFEFFLWKGK